MKKIILCADDYAQSEAISAGIVQLVECGRLSAVSCFTEGEYWTSAQNILPSYRNRIDIGLHFNLTQPFPHATVAAQPLGRILRSAMTAQIDREQIVRALHAQLDRFEEVAAQAPDFIDGHQHVHVLPGIRAVVVAEIARRYSAQKPYLRAVNPRLPGCGGAFKLFVLKMLGAGFGDLANAYGLQTNRGFAGIYSLQPAADFGALMEHWLASAQNGDLLMCHPGGSANDNSDPIAATRPHELAFLLSDKFGAALEQHSVQLSRLAAIEPQ